MPLVYAFSLFGFALSILLVGFLAFVKRQDEIGVRFLIFSIDVFGWAVLISLWISQIFSQNAALWLTRFSHAFSTTIPIIWLHFVLTFCREKEPFKGFYRLFYLIAGLFSLSCFTPFFIPKMHPVGEFKYYPSPGIVYHLFTSVFFILVPYAFWQLIRSLKKSSETEKNKYRFLIAAMVVAFLNGSLTFLPVYGIPFPLYSIPTVMFFPFLMGFALIRYGLFDVQQIADAFQREKITALGIMAASLNHEMRNPLYVAKGKIEAYRDNVERFLYKDITEKSKKADEAIEVITKQLDRTLDIMQRFSDFARPVSLMKKEKIVFEELFQEVLDLVSYEIGKNNIGIKTEFEKGIVLHGNRRQLEEILVNLLINASQAIKEKGGKIKVKAAQINGKSIIEIEDNGPGIAEENRKRIFDPFFSTKGDEGSGLGLYITKQLVEKNGGKISVKSKNGTGTSFYLEFMR